MTVKEAYELFKSTYNKLVVRSCYEYDSCFVFEAVSPKYVDVKDDIIFDCIYSVEKTTGKLTSFKPFDISPDEYKRGREVQIE